MDAQVTDLLAPAPAGRRRYGYELVLVAYHSRPLVEALLAGLPTELPVVIVDNSHGADGLAALAAGRPATRYLDGPGRGYAAGANLGARSSGYETVIFVDPDSRPTPAQLDGLASALARRDDLAVVCAMTVDHDGRAEIGVGGWEPTAARALVHATGAHKLFPTAGLWARPRPGRPLELDWLGGACMAMSMRHFHELGGFDESYFVYSEDVEYGRRIRAAGLRQELLTDMVVLHGGTGSGDGRERMVRLRAASMMNYVRRYHGVATVLGIRLALTAGYLARCAAARLRGRTVTAREHAAYVRGLWLGAPDMI
jgi:N-acetylglucosaminyl-diphospho-decaprenol L-rhamnosyltransferase